MAQHARLSLFVAPAAIQGGAETVRRLFETRMGRPPAWVHSGSTYHAAGLSDGAQAIVCGDGARDRVLLHGELYSDPGTPDDQVRMRLDRLCGSRPLDAARDLRGSHVVVVCTAEALSVVVDRVGSRKIFRWDAPEGSWLDTDLGGFLDRPVDAAGVASLVINRHVYGGRTVLAGVTAMPRASVSRFEGRAWTTREYWQYRFTGAGVASFKGELAARKAELWSLLRQSVRRRMSDAGSTLLFLSGGIDSRAIMAALQAEQASWRGVRATSYGSEADDDALVAGELAASVGMPWSLQPGPATLPELVDVNARHCGGQVFFYPRGLNGIEALLAPMPGPVTAFVGDECYGWNDMTLEGADDALSRGVGIRAPAFVPSYYSYGDVSHEVITQTLQADADALKRRYADVTDWHDLKDLLYLDQRLSFMLLPWRECHLSPFARVVNPHIDEDILDFMQQVPTEYRLNKRLFRETALENLGELGRIRFARSGGCSNDFLDDLFVQHEREIDARIASSDSALDTVLPPDLIRLGLGDLCSEIRARQHRASTLAARSAQGWRAVTRRLALARLGRLRSNAAGSMSLSPIQMGTVLQLRQFFSHQPATGANHP